MALPAANAKKVKVSACLLLVCSLAGGTRRSANVPDRRAADASDIQVQAVRKSLQHGTELFHRGQYPEASNVFQTAFRSAQGLSRPDLAGWALGNLGGSQFAQYQYQAALRSFLEAFRLSESSGDTAKAAAWEANIASLYMQMGEFDAAAQWIEQSLKKMPAPERAQHLPLLKIQLATLRARQARMSEAVELFHEGMEGAAQSGDLKLYAIGWSRLGEAYLTEGNLGRAEAPLLEAHYTRKLHQFPLDASYRDLGRLRLEQGDLTSASTLLDRAVELTASPRSSVSAWDIYHWRGRVRLAHGRLREALDDLRIALRLGRAWRWSTPADDAARVAAEGTLEQVHSTFIEAGNRLYLKARSPAILRETFEAAEENRSTSLRALLGDTGSAKADLPSDYWKALGRLQTAEIAALRTGSTAGLEAARASLIRIEASLGADLPPLPSNLVEASRQAIEPDEVLFCFHLAPNISWVWALGAAGLSVYPLPPRAEIESQVRGVVAAVRDSRPDANALSAALYRTLFGPVALGFRQAPRWLVALDDALFDVPLAALVETVQPRPVYVVEQHTVERIPGIGYWLEAAKKNDPQLAPLFVGLGDAIYNRADARLERAPTAAGDALPLPRLIGSGPEIESCARAWGDPSVLLRGSDVSRAKLVEQLQRRPAAVHLAAHYLESAARSRDGLIALSLSPKGNNELLTPFEISRWRIQAGLIVLSGCHSAVGAALPGTGVLGLTRAWLAAGAQAVVASLGDMPDDEGTLFRPLYGSLRSGGRFDPARALREAQLQMIRSGGIFARPAYWGAYTLVGNPGKMARPL